MAANKVSVELELILKNLRAEAQKAGASIKAELDKSLGKTSGGASNPAAAATKGQADLERQTKKTTSALQKQIEEWRKLNAGGVAPGMKISTGGQANNPSAAIAAQAAAQATANAFGKSGLAAKISNSASSANMPKTLAMAMRLVNPSAPQLPKVSLPPLSNSPKSFWQKNMPLLPGLGAGIGTALGGPIGGALAGVLTKLNPVVAAVTAGMTILRASVAQTAEAFQRANAMYVKTTLSGFGLNGQANRSTLASTIGVSERDIFLFGDAIKQFTGKLAVARQTIVETTPALSYTVMNWRVMVENLRAIWSKVAEAVAPVINRLTELVSAMAKLFTLSGLGTIIGKVVSMLVEGVVRLAAFANIVTAGVMVVFTTIQDVIKNLVQFVINEIARIPGAGKLGIKSSVIPGFGNSKEAASAFADVVKAAIASSGAYNNKSEPQAYMKQLSASSLEKMGLIIGAGGGTNYAAKTAEQTKKTADGIGKLIQIFSSHSNWSRGIPSAA